jgi:ParB-like chromosome segregation protein Spo0J|tara:strand:+ start:98 stop:391 length:294 start_codon:yes stop_codon:yes gene_type:complete
MLKLLKAKTSHPKKIVLKISDLTYLKSHGVPLKELLEGQELVDPIQVNKHKISPVTRYGVNGNIYMEKEWSVHKGNQRVKAAIQLGYTHIEAIVINE